MGNAVKAQARARSVDGNSRVGLSAEAMLGTDMLQGAVTLVHATAVSNVPVPSTQHSLHRTGNPTACGAQCRYFLCVRTHLLRPMDHGPKHQAQPGAAGAGMWQRPCLGTMHRESSEDDASPFTPSIGRPWKRVHVTQCLGPGSRRIARKHPLAQHMRPHTYMRGNRIHSARAHLTCGENATSLRAVQLHHSVIHAGPGV